MVCPSSSSPETTIHSLPPELLDHTLTLVPPPLQQLTALALIRVFPHHHLSRRHLYRHLVVYRGGQLMPLWRALKGDAGMRQGVRSLCMQSWHGDADILNNVMRRLEHLDTLMLNIGTNFAPEHLEDMFDSPRMDLQRMELRFRPYVQEASYYQFLAGSYFDTAIETLTKKWPVCPNFTYLSIVQDLPPRSTQPNTARTTAENSSVNSLASSVSSLHIVDPDHRGETAREEDGVRSVDEQELLEVAPRGYTGHGPFGNPFLNPNKGITKPKSFAQPIVFFDIQCIAAFGASAAAANLQCLRIRVPSRDLAKILIMHPPRGAHSRTLFPELTYLDISTTNVRLDSTLSMLLKQYPKLEHLVMDRVNLFGFTAREKGLELCNDLGNLVVNAGLQRGKEAERQIAAWEVQERVRLAEAAAETARRLEAERKRQQQQEEEEEEGQVAGDARGETDEDRRAREAQEEIERNLDNMRTGRRGHRSAAHSTFSLRDRRRPTTSTASTTTPSSSLPLPTQDKLYLVLPPLPTLRTISVGGEAHTLPQDKVDQWERDFQDGWVEGLERLLGWATHVGDKYERGRKKADEWVKSEHKSAGGAGVGGGGGSGHVKGKGKGKTASTTTGPTSKPKPPLDIRLFRFPLPHESPPSPSILPGPFNLTPHLIPIHTESTLGRAYLEPYRQALADAQLHRDGQGQPPPCVFCTVPDCEGPPRRGAEGEKVDGRGGMGGRHREGCGHMVGRKTWGWDGF